MDRAAGVVKKAFASTVLAIAMVLGTAACQGGSSHGESSTGGAFKPGLSSDTSCSLKVVGNYANFEALESEFERFREYYPNVGCSYVYLDDYNNTIASALRSDEAPDIYVTASWMLDDERMVPLFEDAEVLSDPALKIDLDCIREEVRWADENGDVRMLPVFTRSFGMLVNMDIFEKNGLTVPEDYESLLQVCEKLKAAGYENPLMGANGTTVASMYYSFAFPLFCSNVIGHPESVGALNALEPSAGEMLRPALERIRSFVDAGYLNPAVCTAEIEDDYNAVIMRFFEGDVPMMLGSGDTVSGTSKRESKSEAFSADPFTYKFFVVPLGEEGGSFLSAVSLFFSVNRNSGNLEMTNEFIRFLAREKELGNMAVIKRMITPTDDFSLDEVYSSLEDFPQERTFSYRETGLNDAADTEFRMAAYQVANGLLTVDEAVDRYGSLSK